MKGKARYYSEINIARGIAVLLVLLGHSFPDAQTGFRYPFALWIFDSMYAFHMALFFWLSGFVSAANVYTSKGAFGAEFVKKFRRLMVPYFVYSVITMILKLFMNDYANNPFGLQDMWKIFLGKNPNGGLWYLWTLFVISLLVFGVGKLLKRENDQFKSVFLLALGVVCYLLWRFLDTGFMGNVVKYMFFYNLGIVCNRYYEQLQDKLIRLWCGGLALLLVFVLECPYLRLMNEYILTALLGIYGIFTLALVISKQEKRWSFTCFDFAGDYSYDIYMMSYFVQVPIRVVCWGMLGVPYWIDVVLMLVGGFIGPVLVSKYIIRKVPMFRKMFIGDWK